MALENSMKYGEGLEIEYWQQVSVAVAAFGKVLRK